MSKDQNERNDNLTPAMRREFERQAERDRRQAERNPDTSRVTRIPKAGDQQANMQFDNVATRITTDHDLKEGTPDYRPLRQVELGRASMGHGFSVVKTRFGYSIEQDGTSLSGDAEARLALFYMVAMRAAK